MAHTTVRWGARRVRCITVLRTVVVGTVCALGAGGCGRDAPPAGPPAPGTASPPVPADRAARVPAGPSLRSPEALAQLLTDAVGPDRPDVQLRVVTASDGRLTLGVAAAPAAVLDKLWQAKQSPLTADAPDAAPLKACLERAVARLRSQPGVTDVMVQPIQADTVARQYIRLARTQVDRRRFDQAAKSLDRAEAVAPARWKDAPGWAPPVRSMDRTHARFRQLAMGMLAYHDDRTRYPSGVVSGRNRIGQATWLCAVLPYVGAEDVYHSYNFSRDYAHRSNTTATSRIVEAFLAPGQPMRRHRGGMAVSHFAGVLLEEMDEQNRTFILSVLGRNTRVRVRDIRDGTAQTLLAGQVDRLLPGWAEGDRTLRPIDNGINADPGRGFESPVPGGALFLFVDGHVRFLSDRIDPSVLRALATYNGNEAVDEDQY